MTESGSGSDIPFGSSTSVERVSRRQTLPITRRSRRLEGNELEPDYDTDLALTLSDSV